MSKVKVTREYIDRLKKERDDLQAELVKKKVDLAIHRRFYIFLLKESLESLSKNQAINSKWFSEKLAEHFCRCEKWYWGCE